MVGRRCLGAPFRRVWLLSVAISSTGDGMFLTAFPLPAAALTRDPLLIAGVTVASRLPWLLFSLVAGAIADRVDRRRLMVVADIARTVVVGLLGVAVLVPSGRYITDDHGQRLLAGGLRRRHLHVRRCSVPRFRVDASHQPVVGLAESATGNGYWLVASDGGIFSFGDAVFYGSVGRLALSRPVTGIGYQPRTRLS